jgi:uncharacterized protein (DUF1800 family)
VRGHRAFAILLYFSLAAWLSSLALPGRAAADLPLLDPKAFDRDAAAHLLSRAGFGGTPEEIDEYAALDLDKAVDRLLDMKDSPAPPDFEPTVTQRPTRSELAGLKQEERRKAIQEHQRKDQEQYQKLRGWWLRRMVVSARPLEEKMVLFWHGHFTSSQRDVKDSYHMYLQNRALREGALGSFKELTRRMAKDPAMLEYLDNNKNVRRAPNENFARELLELFTLGIGNYTERDIKEAARALTGWTFRGNEFVFAQATHDPGEKRFLGKSGKLNGDDVIDIIFDQPAVSRFIVRKLFVYFAHDDPPPSVVEALAETLRKHNFEVRPVLARLFRSAEFYSRRSRGNMIKSPVQLVAGTLRLLRVDPGESSACVTIAGRMGQDLFNPPNVKGWEGGKTWISTSTLFDRYNFSRPLVGLDEALAGPAGEAGKKARARRPGLRLPRWEEARIRKELLGEGLEPSPEETVDRIARRFLLVPLPEESRKKLTDFYRSADARRRLAELIHLVLSSAEYQLG